MTAPLVTVGIPVFNMVRFVEESVRSVLSQTYTNLELIVSDNGSTDGTQEVLRRLADSDPRIRLIVNSENRGAAWNWNTVFHHASGDYFCWLPADDRIMPTYVERCVAMLESTPDASLCYAQARLIDAEGEEIRVYQDRLGTLIGSPWRRAGRFVLRINLCNAVLGVHRREKLASTQLMQAFQGADAVLLMENTLSGPVLCVPETLFERRVHAGAHLEANVTRAQREAWWDPNRQAKVWLPVGLRLLLAYLGAAFRARLPLSERLSSALVIAGLFSYRRLRIGFGRWKRRVLSRSPLPPRSRWSGLT